MEEMNALATTPVVHTEICRVENPLAPWNLTLDFDPENLPKALRDELVKLNKNTDYLLTQLNANAMAKQAWVEKVVAWMSSSTEFGPEHFIGDESWERFYGAVVLSEGPLLGANPLSTATERDSFEQRVLATELLTGKMTREKRRRLEERAKSLICSCNPRDEAFFSEETLEECLRVDGLESKKAINEVLGRDAGTYIKASDKRQALWQKWQDRDSEAIQRHRFATGEWGGLESIILDTFSTFAWWEMTGEVFGREWNPHPAVVLELRRALWDVLAEAERRGDSISDYYLDPRDADSWIDIADFTQALREQDQEEWWFDFQLGNTTIQRWMKEVGLRAIYGQGPDWWAEVEDIKEADRKKEFGRERHSIYFEECYWESEVKELVRDNYWKKMDEVLKDA